MKRWCQMSAETFNDMGRNLTLQPNMAASTFPESLCFCSENVQLSGSQSTKFQPRRPTWTSMPWTKSFGWSSMQLQDMGFQTWFRDRPFPGQVENTPNTPQEKISMVLKKHRKSRQNHKMQHTTSTLAPALSFFVGVGTWPFSKPLNICNLSVFAPREAAFRTGSAVSRATNSFAQTVDVLFEGPQVLSPSPTGRSAMATEAALLRTPRQQRQSEDMVGGCHPSWKIYKAGGCF